VTSDAASLNSLDENTRPFVLISEYKSGISPTLDHRAILYVLSCLRDFPIISRDYRLEFMNRPGRRSSFERLSIFN